MKLILKAAALSAAFALAACGGDKTAQQDNGSNAAEAEVNQLGAAEGTLENAADNASGNAADALTNQAEAVSNAADAQKDALENASSNKQ
jgi:hypothetical protein